MHAATRTFVQDLCTSRLKLYCFGGVGSHHQIIAVTMSPCMPGSWTARGQHHTVLLYCYGPAHVKLCSVPHCSHLPWSACSPIQYVPSCITQQLIVFLLAMVSMQSHSTGTFGTCFVKQQHHSKTTARPCRETTDVTCYGHCKCPTSSATSSSTMCLFAGSVRSRGRPSMPQQTTAS